MGGGINECIRLRSYDRVVQVKDIHGRFVGLLEVESA